MANLFSNIVTAPSRGTQGEFTLDTAETIVEVLAKTPSETYYNEATNWSKVLIFYKSSSSGQKSHAIFDYSAVNDNVTDVNATFDISTTSLGDFLVEYITIIDHDGGRFKINKGDLDPAQLAQMNVILLTTNIYVAHSQGADVSKDFGATWSKLGDGGTFTPSGVCGRVMKDDIGGIWVVEKQLGNLKHSTDGGDNFVVNSVSSGINANSTLDVVQNSAGAIFVVTASTLKKSVNYGSSWTSTNLAGSGTGGIAIDPNNDLNMMIGSNAGVQVSVDGGVSWALKTTANGLLDNSVGKLHGVGFDANGTWMCDSTNSPGAINVSADGLTWTQATVTTSTNTRFNGGFWNSPTVSGECLTINSGPTPFTVSADSFASVTESNPSILANNTFFASFTASADGQLIVASTTTFAYISTDGGATWIAKSTEIHGGFGSFGEVSITEK